MHIEIQQSTFAMLLAPAKKNTHYLQLCKYEILAAFKRNHPGMSMFPWVEFHDAALSKD